MPPIQIESTSTPLSTSVIPNVSRRPAEGFATERPAKIRRLDVSGGSVRIVPLQMTADEWTPRRPDDENARPAPRTEPTKGPMGRVSASAVPAASQATKGKGRYAPRPRQSEPGPR
jgi:hypothetical protein